MNKKLIITLMEEKINDLSADIQVYHGYEKSLYWLVNLIWQNRNTDIFIEHIKQAKKNKQIDNEIEHILGEAFNSGSKGLGNEIFGTD